VASGTRLILLRHGTTDANTSGLFLGHTDAPLSPRGHLEVEALGARLAETPFDVLVASDLQRAHHTALGVAAAHLSPMEVQTERRLREMHLGDFEGVPASTVHAENPELISRWVNDPADVRMPGPNAETLTEVQARAWEAVSALVDAHRGGRIAVVSHTFTLLMLVCRVLDLPIRAFRRLHIDRASITEIQWNRFGAAMRRFNDTAHLDSLPPAEH